MVKMNKLMALLVTIALLASPVTGCVTPQEEETTTQGITTVENETTVEEEITSKKEMTTEETTEAAETTAEGTAEEETTATDETNAETLYTVDGDKVYFGSYPQSVVTDTDLTATLTAAAGPLPTEDDFGSWISYEYYLEGEISDYMWYIDLEHGGSTYRGVYFTAYRPDFSVDESTAEEYSKQAARGYYTDTVYWFKYEPLSWTILKRGSNGKVMLLCDRIIDVQEFCIDEQEIRTVDGETVYPNNYEHSRIREWLNDTFYETAFSDLQKELILVTRVDNSAASTESIPNVYACNDTMDRIFLLSYADVTNDDYGFSSDYTSYDRAKHKQTTAYAQAMGATTFSDQSDYPGNGQWWLRSPVYITSMPGLDRNGKRVQQVCPDGTVHFFGNLNSTGTGVVPALRIQLTE